MFRIKGIYKGNTRHITDKEYEFFLNLTSHYPLQIRLDFDKYEFCYFYSFDELIEDWDIISIELIEDNKENEFNINYKTSKTEFYNRIKSYIRNRKIKLIING